MTSKRNWKEMQMTKPSFVYVIYIATTQEKLWQALVDTDITAKYWVGVKADSTAHEPPGLLTAGCQLACAIVGGKSEARPRDGLTSADRRHS
jgi:hypothetical protein